METINHKKMLATLFNTGLPPEDGRYIVKAYQYWSHQHRFLIVEYSTTEGWLTPLPKGTNYIGWAPVDVIEKEQKNAL